MLSVSIPSSVNSPEVVAPKMAISSASSSLLMASRSKLFEMKTIARVGVKPSAMVFFRAISISAADFPLIDFAFMAQIVRAQAGACTDSPFRFNALLFFNEHPEIAQTFACAFIGYFSEITTSEQVLL